MRHRLVSPGAEQFIPFAESCIIKLKKLGLPYADQSFEVDGCSIKVRIEPGHEYIRIEGGQQDVYEFFATSPTLNPNIYGSGSYQDTLNPDGSAVRIYFGSTAEQYAKKRGTAVMPDAPTMVSVPVWSSLFNLSDPPITPSWAYVDRRWYLGNHIYLGGKAYRDNFVSNFSQPGEHFGVSSWYYGNKTSTLVTSARAFGPGSSLQSQRPVDDKTAYLCALSLGGKYAHWSYGNQDDAQMGSSPYTTLLGDRVFGVFKQDVSTAAFTSSYPMAWLDTRLTWPATFVNGAIMDIATPVDSTQIYRSIRYSPESLEEKQGANVQDVTPAAYSKSSLKVGAGNAGPYASWRTAAVHKTTDINGGEVSLFVLTDSAGGFMFYEALNYASSSPDFYDNLPANEWARVKPAMPGWVTTPPESAPYRELHWTWRFNKDATKAVCTPINSVPGKVYLIIDGGIGYTFLTRDECDIYALLSPPILPVEVEVYSIRFMSGADATAISNRWSELNAIGKVNDANPAAGSSAHFFKYLGDYYLLRAGGVFLGAAYSFTAAVSAAAVLNKDITPGFVEVGISVLVTYDDQGKMLLSPEVHIIDSDYYDVSGKIYVDAAYYVATTRAKTATDSLVISYLPEDDTLLLADVVLRGVADVTQFSAGQFHTRGQYPVKNAYGYYRVTDRRSGNLVTSLLLLGGVQMGVGYDDYSLVSAGLAPVFFYSQIVASDLRYLAFVTATYYRRRCGTPALRASEPQGRAFMYYPNVPPRIELRIPGVALRTIDYSKDSWSGYAPETMSDTLGVMTSPDTDMSTSSETVVYGVVNGFTVSTTTVSSGSKYGDASKLALGIYGGPSLGPDPLILTPLNYLGQMKADTSTATRVYSIQATYVFEGTTYLQDTYTNTYTPSVSDLPPSDEFTAHPESKKRLMQQLIPQTTSGQYYSVFTFTPKGDYAVYFDFRSGHLSVNARSTETSGVFDIISVGRDKTSHLKALNAAFKKNLDYAYIPIEDPIRVGRLGMNGIFIYGPPSDI